MRLAFAIPYAGGSREFLSRAIESVRAQTHVDWTLTVVDDSREPADLQSILGRIDDPRIRTYVHAGPHGIGAAWNACIAATEGDFLTILHADDELDADYAREMLAIAQRFPDAALLYCNVRIIDADGNPIVSLRDGFKRAIQPRGDVIVLHGTRAIERFCLGNFVLAPTVLYRRAAITGRSFSTDYRFVLDLDFLVDTLLLGQTIAGTARELLRYRRHASQQTALLDRDTTRADEEIAYYRALATRLRVLGKSRAAVLARLRLSTRLSGMITALADIRRGRMRTAYEKIRRSTAL